jgi:2-methylcitrate dehydratase PrpD
MISTMTERLADHVCELLYEDLPPEVIAKTKDVVAHDLAVAVAGSRSTESALARAFAGGPAGGPGRSRVIGTADMLAPLDAAFVNAVMMRALRQEDTILPSFVHPGPILIPAALAVAEHVGATGPQILTAVVAGYDVLGAVAGSEWSWSAGARTSSHIYGAIGAAVVTAKLLGCDRQQTAKAIAYAGNLGAMITYGFDNHQYGLVMRNGMTAAFLGQARCPAPADALEGPYGFYHAQVGRVPPDIEDRIERLGKDFEVMTAVLKPHPCTALNLVAVQLLQQTLAEHRLSGADVVELTVSRSSLSDLVPNVHSTGPWASATESISSLPFALAAVLLDGSVTSTRLHRPNDPDVTERARHVRIELIDTADLLEHGLELRTAGGATVEARASASILRAPQPRDVLGATGTAVIGARQADRLFRIVAELETLDSVSELTECFVPATSM